MPFYISVQRAEGQRPKPSLTGKLRADDTSKGSHSSGAMMAAAMLIIAIAAVVGHFLW
jgi:hypothetical protein